MTTTSSDISVTLSGGSNNLDPNESLGGSPSATPVTDNTLNNLFEDVSPEQNDDGLEDYRCLYIFNDGETDIYSLRLWISNDFEDGSVIAMGVDGRDERQRITISGALPTGGTMTLSYNTVEFTSTARTNVGTWASELQDQLNALELSGESLLSGVTVAAQTTGTTIVFDIVFGGFDGKRSQPTIQLESNALTPSATVSITTPQVGSPVNTIASEINVSTSVPGGVTFTTPSVTSPIRVPKLLVGEGFPFWIRRSTAAGTSAKENDGFQMQFLAESLKPSE